MLRDRRGRRPCILHRRRGELRNFASPVLGVGIGGGEHARPQRQPSAPRRRRRWRRRGRCLAGGASVGVPRAARFCAATPAPRRPPPAARARSLGPAISASIARLRRRALWRAHPASPPPRAPAPCRRLPCVSAASRSRIAAERRARAVVTHFAFFASESSPRGSSSRSHAFTAASVAVVLRIRRRLRRRRRPPTRLEHGTSCAAPSYSPRPRRRRRAVRRLIADASAHHRRWARARATTVWQRRRTRRIGRGTRGDELWRRDPSVLAVAPFYGTSLAGRLWRADAARARSAAGRLPTRATPDRPLVRRATHAHAASGARRVEKPVNSPKTVLTHATPFKKVEQQLRRLLGPLVHRQVARLRHRRELVGAEELGDARARARRDDSVGVAGGDEDPRAAALLGRARLGEERAPTSGRRGGWSAR